MRRPSVPCRFPSGPILRHSGELEVNDLAAEEALHVSGARVVLAEYDLIQHDFPELSVRTLLEQNPALGELPPETLEATTCAIIDEWLVLNAACVSSAQIPHTTVNTPISTDGYRTIAFRPPKYGRAIVVPTHTESFVTKHGGFRVPGTQGLLDLKGAGIAPGRSPSSRPQSSGLEYLGIALSDFLVKKAVDEILCRALPTVWTVPVYAVLDLGFDVTCNTEFGVGPAGLHVRRAHRRRIEDKACLEEHEATLDIEMTLRSYGVTTSTLGLQHHLSRKNGGVTLQRGRGPVRHVIDAAEVGLALALLGDAERVTLDRRDVQLAREVDCRPTRAQIVDFGAFRVVSRFDSPMVRFYDQATFDQVIWPGDPDFRQPDPHLQLPIFVWERRALAMRCLELATMFRRGAISAIDLRSTFDAEVQALRDQWSRPALA